MPTDSFRRWSGLLLAATLAAVLGYGLYFGFDVRWPQYATGDWVAYWSIPRGLWLGHGYFDAPWLTATQEAVGYRMPDFGPRYEETFWPLWNPPPLVTLLMPIGALPFTLATMTWLALSALLYGDAAMRFNRQLPRPLPDGMALVVAFFFLPFFVAMFWGQVTPLLAAFGIYAWLAFRRRRYAAAGVLLVPLLLKPHLLFVEIILLGGLALRRRAWGLPVAFGGLTLALTLVSFGLDPTWIEGWITQGSPVDWQSFALWDILKVAFDLPPWSQFVGLPLGALVALWRYRRTETVPPRLLGEAALLSVLFSPYVWHHDVTVTLPAALWVGSMLWARGWQVALLAQTVLNLFLMPADLSVLFLPYVLLYVILWAVTSRPVAQRAISDDARPMRAS